MHKLKKDSLLFRVVTFLLVISFTLGAFYSPGTGGVTGNAPPGRPGTVFSSLSRDFPALAVRAEDGLRWVSTALSEGLAQSLGKDAFAAGLVQEAQSRLGELANRLFFIPTAMADPGKVVGASPDPFSSLGGSTTISWQYQWNHSTEIYVEDASGAVVYTLCTDKEFQGGGGVYGVVDSVV